MVALVVVVRTNARAKLVTLLSLYVVLNLLPQTQQVQHLHLISERSKRQLSKLIVQWIIFTTSNKHLLIFNGADHLTVIIGYRRMR